ncbi:MAG: fructose-1,6-bisphosphate aldolase/phosphatase [Candidatus Micrarchaeota archaeon]|nr:fructose-1,6-bisphosphate aldolase/phosphatase [Candidatus Micrarchaeota archaeon]
MEKVTLSVIKADVGGHVGHSAMHPKLPARARKELEESKKGGKILDYCVTHCGDDLELIMTHRGGVDDEEIHKIAWDVFMACTGEAKALKLYGAGQDMLKDSFSGNVKGMGPGVAELAFTERKSEPVLVFMADKTAPGAWNLPLYKIFADPFNTIGLIIDPAMHDGFTFEVLDAKEGKTIEFNTPEEMYDLLAYIGSTGRYLIKTVKTKKGEPCAASSTQKLSQIAGKYVGKDDPVCFVRCQSGMPAVGEVLEPFSFPHLVTGWMRGSHNGPLMPVSVKQATPSRFDGPPRVTCLGFQLNEGMLGDPRDMFDDPSFDQARSMANKQAYYMRMHGPFEPHRLPPEDLEYTALPQIQERVKHRFKPV